MLSNILYNSTAQRPHVGVHSSTGHTPRVHNQAYLKELQINISLINLQTTRPNRWSVHTALQSDSYDVK